MNGKYYIRYIGMNTHWVKPTYQHFLLLIILLFASGIARSQSEHFSYGLNLGVNYSLIGAENNNYSGEGNPTLGMFLQLRPENGFGIGHPTQNKTYTIISDDVAKRLTFIIQPAFTVNSFRELATDRKYNNYYVEIGGFIYVQPFTYVNEFNIFTGIRPSYLTAYNTELFENGFYNNKPYDGNQNRVGRADFVVPVGMSMALSEAVSLEVAYLHSFTDHNTTQTIKGRPSSVELTLRLNALGLVNQFSHKEETLRDKINKLSKGSLLVMLPTPNPAEIEKLKADRKVAEVEAVQTEIRDRNKRVMQEFKAYFDFCPVYFFMDTSAYKIISRNFNGVFVNNDLVADPYIKPDSSNFFVASFCNDISAYTTKHQYGLFVYDDKINQLPKPFNVPANLVGSYLEGDVTNYFKKRHYNYSQMSFEKVITRFNNRLLRYKN